MSEKDWIWMPHPGHFICSRDCKFHMTTKVGRYIVSTVGELLFDAPVREIMAHSRGVKLVERGDARIAEYMKKIGYEDIGAGRKYETMVFRAMKGPKGNEDGCCPYRMRNGQEMDFAGYNDPTSAFKGHYAMCKKWDKQNKR